MLDWLRFWPELIRLNLAKTRHRRRVLRLGPAAPLRPAPCQSSSDSGRPRETRCEACHRFDRSQRYRRICPDLVFIAGEARCARSAADVRPYWGRAAAQLLLPLVALYLGVGLTAWGTLRVRGLARLSPVDILLPTRWSEFAEHRRAHFQLVALRALADRDPATASVALLTAAQTGQGTAESNLLLARIATLGGYHSLADELHAKNLARHPDRAADLCQAWLDDLLISDRPNALARLSLERLALPGEPREPWLRAFFESIRHPGVAAALLQNPPSSGYPHPGLRFALAARDALDRGDRMAAADQLLALSGSVPGEATRRFLAFSWLDAKDPARAREAALSTAYSAPAGEIAVLSHALLQAANHPAGAREALRTLFKQPAASPKVLAALVRAPDAELLREFVAGVPEDTRSDVDFLVGLWVAAHRADSPDLAAQAAEGLKRIGKDLPAEILISDSSDAGRKQLALVASLIQVHREVLYALREAPWARGEAVHRPASFRASFARGNHRSRFASVPSSVFPHRSTKAR